MRGAVADKDRRDTLGAQGAEPEGMRDKLEARSAGKPVEAQLAAEQERLVDAAVGRSG